MMELRQRKGSNILKSIEFVKEFDTFPKATDDSETFVKKWERTRIGGAVSVIAGLLIFWIIKTEVLYYIDSYLLYKFAPDTDFNAKLKLNIDLTVAMPCHSIGADVVDSTDQNLLMFGNLEEEDTWFQLSPEQAKLFETMKQYNSYLREEFHAIHEVLWKTQHASLGALLPSRIIKPSHSPDACRVYGTLVLNKVAGNFHITAGKSLPINNAHIHISAFTPQRFYNFSHRINHFSFGDYNIGMIHPLDGDEKITKSNFNLYQYFIEVVPTDVISFLQKEKTYQYSVKDHERIIDHDKGSHGVPGIFFKYDMSALKVIVSEERDEFYKFFIRLCATISGVYVIARIIHDILQFLSNLFKSNEENKSIKTPIFVANNY